MDNVFHVLIVGLGNIGSRHMEALAKANFQARLTIVEPSAEINAKLEERRDWLSENFTDYKRVSSLSDVNETIDLAIVATNSSIRYAIIDELVTRLDVKKLIFEKVLFQTLGELERTQNLLRENSVKAHVNCGRRGFESYQQLRSALNVPTDINVTGSNYGLASNGIHFLDLIEFLNQSSIVELDGSMLDEGYIPAKREGYVEVFGTIRGVLANGAHFRVQCGAEGSPSVTVICENEAGEITVHETAAKIEDERETDQDLSGAFQFQYVSEASQFYEQLLKEGRCDLVDYEASARQHRYFLTTLLEHMGKPVTADSVCPIS